jgi:hypothetical protein
VGVAGLAFLDRAGRCLLDAGRRGEVWLAHLQVDDVIPLGLQLSRPLQHLHGEEGSNLLGALGDHGHPPGGEMRFVGADFRG